jgi:hypothetical protein
MSQLFDPTGDFEQVVDGKQPITLHRPGGGGSLSIEAALRRAVTTREADASEGKYSTSDVVWLLPASGDNPQPQVGDRIVEAEGSWWTILASTRDVAGARWRCHARRLDIENGPAELVTIQRATWTKGTSGALAPTWNDLYAGVPARIQPTSAAQSDDRQRRMLKVTHEVYLAEPVELAQSDRIVSVDGRRFLVVGFEKPSRIDALLVAHVAEQAPAE